MSTVTKVYTFTNGTKADATEVNKDFDDIYAGVNALSADVVQRSINIMHLPAPFVSAVGDGVTDDYQAYLNAKSLIGSHGGKIYWPNPPVKYRITQPLDLIVSGVLNPFTFVMEGESQLNTQIYLDNDAAVAALTYDNGSKTFDVTGCSVTNGSAIMTTTGNFNTSGVAAGMTFSCNGVPAGASVVSVDSNTQLTLNVNANATKAAFTTRFYKLVTTTNRLVLKNLFITNSKANVMFTSWHSATGILLKGCHDYQITDVRVDSFTMGLYSLGGYLSKFDNFMAQSCYNGFLLEYSSFASELRNVRCNNSGANAGGYAGQIRDSGSVTLINFSLEGDKQGLLLEGVRACEIVGGNVESISNSYSIKTMGLSIIESSNQEYWTSGVDVSGIRFYNALGILFLNGSRAINFHSNSFIVNASPPFAVSNTSFIHSSGDYQYMADINYGGNRYPTAGIPIAATLTGTNASPQSISENRKIYASQIPYYGKYWTVGTIVWNIAPPFGGILYWICATASDGVNDGSATWKAIQNGYASSISGTPPGINFYSLVGALMYVSVGNSSSADWKQIN